MKNENIAIVLVWVAFFVGMLFGGWLKGEQKYIPYQKGQHFDLRGGSVVIENNEKDSVVWFKNDSTYFYETYKTLGIDGR